MATLQLKTGLGASIERQYEALSSRDQKLVVGLLAFFVLVGLGGLLFFLNGALDDKADRVRSAKATYQTVERLEGEYVQATSLFASQESRLQQYASRPVSAWIEDLATEHAIIEQLRSVNEVGQEVVGDLVSTDYSVEFKRAEQESLYRFLYDLETNDFPAQVRQADFKVAFVKKERKMDLRLDLTVLSLAEL